VFFCVLNFLDMSGESISQCLGCLAHILLNAFLHCMRYITNLELQ